jgi:MYXO-CTERM domain-containing protein
MAVGGGFAHTCALGTDHSLACWGDGSQGQLGNGSRAPALTPQQLGRASDWSGLALGYAHTCGLTASGVVWCWGDATWGQLTGAPGAATGTPVASCGAQPARAPITTQCGCSADTTAPRAAAGAPLLVALLVARRRRRRESSWMAGKMAP